MTKRTWLTYGVRTGILIVVAVSLLVWVRSRGHDAVSPGPRAGLQWLQHQPQAARPTIAVSSRWAFLPRPGPTSTPPAPPPGLLPHPVITEALAKTGAAEYHRHGYTGQDVKVAVVDTQFDGLDEAIATGELPSNIVSWRLTADGDLVENLRPGAGPHGTACAEIIHDLAPSAELILVQVDNFLQTSAAMFSYLEQKGVRIVSLSISVLAIGRADGTGVLGTPPIPIYDILRDAYETKNMLIVISAGNYARQHYTGRFHDADGNGLHDYDCPALGACDEAVRVATRKGEAFTVYLSWDDWGPAPPHPSATSDYDLIIIDPQGQIAGSSTITQANGVPPVEVIRITPEQEGDYAIRILRKASTREAHNLRLWLAGATLPLARYQTPEGSLAPPADAESVIAVGAANVETGLRLAASSQGPTRDGRIKPDITGYAQVSVSNPAYGPHSFSGTSAATPHVAGIATLMLGRGGPTMAAETLRDQLLAAAIDRGDVGPDPLWGHGLATLPPLETVVTILEPSTKAPGRLDSYGRLTVTAEVQRSDGTHIDGLNADAFRIKLAGISGTVIAAQDLGNRYVLRARWPTPLLPITGSETRMAALNLTVLTSDAVAADEGAPDTDPQESSPIQLTLEPVVRTSPLGAPIPLVAILEDGHPVLGARIIVDVSAPIARHDTILLVDDGQSSDGTAGDGVYAGRYTMTQIPGIYVFSVRAFTGVTGVGAPQAIGQLNIDVTTSLSNWDGDGLPEAWESTMGLNALRNDRYGDPDADGLNNEEEYLHGSDPHNWDSDNDTLCDLDEVAGDYSTRPYNSDSDLGGIGDAAELNNGTDPLDPTDDWRIHDIINMPDTHPRYVPPRMSR